MKKFLLSLFSSKKFVAALFGLVTSVGVKLGWQEADITEILALISPIIAYIVGQGIADIGKEAQKVDHEQRKADEAEMLKNRGS